MHPHPATQAQNAAQEAPHPHARAASAVELLLLVLLQALIAALLAAATTPAKSSGAGRSGSATTRATMRLITLLLRLLARAHRRGAIPARAVLPRCLRPAIGELQVIIALIHGRPPRPRARPAAMPPARPRRARSPPLPPSPGIPANPQRTRLSKMLRHRNKNPTATVTHPAFRPIGQGCRQGNLRANCPRASGHSKKVAHDNAT